ncbi:MAG: hypothetical protein A2Y38_25060 [Spirochaetes bacterium GWB1_59_5]|nr:MAG: hypothetical protein A2Y38_25060 [Spirochaetes bacterium GWB1_59_5]
MKYKGLAVLVCVVLGSIPLVGVEAQATAASVKAFPDYLSVRSEFLSAVITAAPSNALNFKTAYRDSPAGRIRISVEREGPSFYVLFQREQNGSYPVGSRGNIVIKRDAVKGYITRVVWFLSDDGKSFLSLTPNNERTVVDYVVAGSVSRGGYSVARLIYYFITNTFGYLYDATRSGIDWSPIIGSPGPSAAAALAAEFISGHLSGVSDELVKTAGDFSVIGRYLEAAGKTGAIPEELTSTPYLKAASFSNPLDPSFIPIQAWSETHGLPIESAALSMLAGIEAESAYIALLSGAGSQPSIKLAVVPYIEVSGAYAFAAIDAMTRQPVDFRALIAAMPGANIRLFRVPLPPVR